MLLRLDGCAGVVSTLAGSGSASWADGLGIAAGFNNPYGASVDSNGAVYVADYNSHRIRKVSSSGVYYVGHVLCYPRRLGCVQ